MLTEKEYKDFVGSLRGNRYLKVFFSKIDRTEDQIQVSLSKRNYTYNIEIETLYTYF